MLLLMPSTRIAQNTQVSSEIAKKGEITLNDMFTFSHWPKHHLICQDSGEQSRDLNDPFVQSCEDMPASVLSWIRTCIILGLQAP